MSSSALLPPLPVTDEWLAKKLAAEGQRKLKARQAPAEGSLYPFRPRPDLTKAQADFFARLCPHAPHPKQREFIDCTAREALFGGGGGGGKTDGALMRLLKYADTPGYAGLALRVNFAQMMKSDAILARAIEWWRGLSICKYDAQTHTFKFECPGSAYKGAYSEIAFGHMDSALSYFDYQGMAAQQVVFDELTHFQQKQYTYLFSRQRRPTSGPASSIPLFQGATANPGGVGHRWVYERFIDPATRGKRVWIESTVEDNPSIDLVTYEESLAELDPVTRKQLRHGSWEELAPGDFFDQSNFVIVDEPPPRFDAMVRYWDFASKEVTKKNKDPDFTASCLMGFVRVAGDQARGIKAEDIAYVLDATEDRWPAGDVPSRVGLQAAEDGVGVAVRWEEEGGSSGAIASERAIKPELAGHDADGIRSTGSKMERARPYAGRVSKRKVFVLKRAWTKKWMDQHHQFPAVDHDDLVDASSGAFNFLDAMPSKVPEALRGGMGVTDSLTKDRSGRKVRLYG